jgi:hypothetical protein
LCDRKTHETIDRPGVEPFGASVPSSLEVRPRWRQPTNQNEVPAPRDRRHGTRCCDHPRGRRLGTRSRVGTSMAN